MFVRVIANYRDGGHIHKNHKLVLLCSIDEEKQLEDGEWMGYIMGDALSYPFILKEGSSCFYGWEEHYAEPTNIGKQLIQVGSYFTIFNQPGADRAESAFEIVSVEEPTRANIGVRRDALKAAPRSS